MKAEELRRLAVDWIKETWPTAIIVPEMSVADWGGAMLDLGVITETEIVGIEIKGEGDSPSRLELQGLVYGRVARRMWLLPDESLAEKCYQARPRGWGRLEVHEERVRPFNRATKFSHVEERVSREGYKYQHRATVRDHSRYDPCEALEQRHLCPRSMCGTLWRNEIYEIARLTGVQCGAKATVGWLTDAICAQLPAPLIHTMMVDQLRRRTWSVHKPVIDLRPREAKVEEKGMLL